MSTTVHPGLERAELIADLMDDAVELPILGKVGLDPLIGLLPAAGDSVSALISLYIVFEAWNAGVPRSKLAKMAGYIGLDWVVGSIPVVGDLFDVYFRANRRSVRLFRDHVESA
jgi:hypothetical protein